MLRNELASLPEKPAESAPRREKKSYSESLSRIIALAFGAELRARGLEGALPIATGSGKKGAERRMAGGIGAKKVDVTWATEESGLLLALSIKTINFRDERSGNYQKNLVNRRGDALIEAVTLHRRFPYAVLGAFFFLDKGAEEDATAKRSSTFLNSHARLRLFTGRLDPAGRDEQYELMYLSLVDAAAKPPEVRTYPVGGPDRAIPLAAAFDALIRLVAERNPDFYEFVDGSLRRVPG